MPGRAWKPAECGFRRVLRLRVLCPARTLQRLGEPQTRRVAMYNHATRRLSGIWEAASRVSLRLKAGPGVTKLLDKARWYERCGCLAEVTQLLLRRGSSERPAMKKRGGGDDEKIVSRVTAKNLFWTVGASFYTDLSRSSSIMEQKNRTSSSLVSRVSYRTPINQSRCLLKRDSSHGGRYCTH